VSADGHGVLRPVWAEIDLDALRHNAEVLCRLAAPAALCAVVKADAYGHGALPAARAVLEGGATWLAVALVEEGAALRAGGIQAPILLLSEPPPRAMREAVAWGLTPTIYTRSGVDAVAQAAETLGRDVEVHVKVDTGMHRVGVSPHDAPEIVGAVVGARRVCLGGLFTHLAVAEGVEDGEDRAFTHEQLRRFAEVRELLAAAGIRAPLVHAANSAATIAYPESRLDMVRCGISLYGELPAPGLGSLLAERSGGAVLRPVLSLRARVSFVRELEAGARPSYGRHYPLPVRSQVAVIPIGYADGISRRLFTHGGFVLIGGRRCPIAGTVTMDQIVVDCGPGADVQVGDDVVLLGTQGAESVHAGDWADLLGTISYEVLCGISARVPRVAVGAAAREAASTVSGGQDHP
jgi:alanine racemase